MMRCLLAASVSLIALAGAGAAIAGGTTAPQSLPTYDLVADCGAPTDGLSDATPAMIACAQRNGGAPKVINIPPGIFKMNFVDIYPGVIFEGPGWGLQSGKNPPTANYLAPYNTASPVFQMAQDDGNEYAGMTLRDVTLNCNGTGQYGFRFAAGSYTDTADHVQVLGCTAQDFGLIGGAHSYSAKDRFVNFHIGAYVAGSEAIALIDPTSGSTVFSNDIQMANGSVSASNDSIAIHNDSSTAQMSNIKMDMKEGGVVLEKHAIAPVLYMSSISLDSNNSTDNLVIYKNFGDPALTATGAYPAVLQGTPAVDGTSLAVINNTSVTPAAGTESTPSVTGTVSSGALNVLNVSSASGAEIGKVVLIRAPAIGLTYSATILGISGTALTLSVNAPTGGLTATEVDIGWPVQGQKGITNPSGVVTGGSLMLNDNYKTGYGLPAFQPVLFGSHGSGAVAPYNAGGLVMETGAYPFSIIMGQDAMAAATSYTQVGNTITVKTAANHNLLYGDPVLLTGAQQAGFNGTYAVASVVDSTDFTVTSAISQTVNATAGSGGLLYSGGHVISFQNGSIYTDGNGFQMRTQYGTSQILSACGSTQKELCVYPPGASNSSSASGYINFGFGNNVLGSAFPVFEVEDAFTPFTTVMGANGGGGFHLGPTDDPWAAPSLYLTDAAGDDTTNLNANDGLFYDDGGSPHWKYGNIPAVPVETTIAQGAAPGLTGTCATSGYVGGQTTGGFLATCSAGQTVVITFAAPFAPAAQHGWDCEATDYTTHTKPLIQSAYTTTSCTLYANTATGAGDAMLIAARGF